ncbi:helix-turn-helix domain-containing protein [Nocardia otitidiscaviarum]|uniref:helix-turn-helix transcriptional regulator n=1 Tax=Nocardia otitidiscaviarum TaxID=1823 RepID=UPI0004A76545|nr:helix-turn-helix transcriptional regulator [Nocardia otitidiscaviarum]MBF6133737.1 helix-turn-helix domain-containing protein [Nocardia otitidiscaviarum]MBF6487765.1 helix-turn-helix domain-containing protein [Nocardia otitidiscaviarum]
MESDNQLGQFLRARRALTRPEEFGLPGGGRRRVVGLRREEVALLAGMSADYYTRLEQGRDRHPSEQVIEALARVLGLDAEGAAHLRELARPMARRRRAPRGPERVAPGLMRLMDAWPLTPAVVLGRYLDVLAANHLATAVNHCSVPGVNQVRMVFLDPEARSIYPDWAAIAADTVAVLRGTAGTDPEDPRLIDLVGELSLRSADFRRLWARHDVAMKTSGSKRFTNPLVGELELGYETFTVNDAPGQVLIVYHAEPDSPAAHGLTLLGSMNAPTPTARTPTSERG